MNSTAPEPARRHPNGRTSDAKVFLYAFDLIELDGDDLRREPLAVRKATLASLLTQRRDCVSTST